jgi:hypothetical protein
MLTTTQPAGTPRVMPMGSMAGMSLHGTGTLAIVFVARFPRYTLLRPQGLSLVCIPHVAH